MYIHWHSSCTCCRSLMMLNLYLFRKKLITVISKHNFGSVSHSTILMYTDILTSQIMSAVRHFDKSDNEHRLTF